MDARASRGDMVVGAGGAAMRLVDYTDDGRALCVVVDHDGRIRRELHYRGSLRPVREMMQPRSCWAETRQVDQIEFEREELAAAEARRQARRAARKSKRSLKAKRRKTVAA